MNPKYESLEVLGIKTHGSCNHFSIGWDAPKIGFGEITIFIGNDEKLHVDTE